MRCFRQVCRITSAIMILYPPAVARANPALALDEPLVVDKQPAEYGLQVQEDGLTVLHLKWADPASGRAQSTIDLSLSTFTGDGQIAVVGFDPGKPGLALLPYLRSVTVPADGVAIRLTSVGLTPNIDYAGTLFAVVGKDVGKERLSWKLTLTRPGAIPPFRCPPGTQIVNPDGSITADFQQLTPLSVTAVDLHLSPFVSRDNELGQIGFPPAADGGELRHQLPGVPLDGRHLLPPLRAIGLTEAATYTGKLRLVGRGQDLLECPLTVLMPKLPRAELVTDRQTLVQTVTKRWWPFGNHHDDCAPNGEARPDTSVTLRLFEKTRTQPMYGIAAVQDGTAASADGQFDLGRHASFKVNGRPVSNFMQLQPPDLRAAGRMLPPGGQMNVQMDLHALHAGTYTFALRFTGVNAASPTPKVDVTIHVRHHWLWAAIAILVALLVSLTATTVIVGWRERIRLRGRIQQMRDQSFAEHSDLAIVVLLRTLLAQTETMLARRYILPPPDSAHEHLTQAERVVTILRKYRELGEALDGPACPPRIKEPYRKAIAEAIQRIPDPLDQGTTDAILEQLGAIKTRLAAPFGWYWSSLKSEAKLIAQQFKEVPESLRPELAGLMAKLKDPPIITDEQDALFDAKIAEFDRCYWFFKLLHSRRRYPGDVKALVDWYQQHQNIDMVQLFAKADELAWKRLELEVQRDRVKIERADAGEEQQALRPMKFRLKFVDQEFADSYFMNNILFYEWQFTARGERSWWRWLRDRLARRSGRPAGLLGETRAASNDESSTRMMLDSAAAVTVKQPRVTTYVRCPGEVTIGAMLRWESPHGARLLPITKITCPVGNNAEVSLVGRQSLTLLLHYGVMAVIALITALPTLYVGKPSFGSFGDYVAILAWAVGIDQGKNLVQLLKTVPADKQSGASTP